MCRWNGEFPMDYNLVFSQLLLRRLSTGMWRHLYQRFKGTPILEMQEKDTREETVKDYQTIMCHNSDDSNIRMNYLFTWRHQQQLETFEKTYLHDEEFAFLLFDKKTLQHWARWASSYIFLSYCLPAYDLRPRPAAARPAWGPAVAFQRPRQWCLKLLLPLIKIGMSGGSDHSRKIPI